MNFKKLISLITSFLPWLSFTVFSVIYPPLAIPAGLISSLATYPKLKKGFILDWATVLFFVILFVDYQIFKDQWLVHHIEMFISLFFVGISAISILIHQPFTIQYAKLEVKKESWKSPLFYRCNLIVTAGIGLIFLLMALANLIRIYFYPVLNPWLIWGVAILAQIILIQWYPKWFRKKYPH